MAIWKQKESWSSAITVDFEQEISHKVMLNLLYMMFKDGQTYYKNLALRTPPDVWSIFGHFSVLCMKGVKPWGNKEHVKKLQRKVKTRKLRPWKNTEVLWYLLSKCLKEKIKGNNVGSLFNVYNKGTRLL